MSGLVSTSAAMKSKSACSSFGFIWGGSETGEHRFSSKWLLIFSAFFTLYCTVEYGVPVKVAISRSDNCGYLWCNQSQTYSIFLLRFSSGEITDVFCWDEQGEWFFRFRDGVSYIMRKTAKQNKSLYNPARKRQKKRDRKFTSKAACLNSDDYTKRSEERIIFVELIGPWWCWPKRHCVQLCSEIKYDNPLKLSNGNINFMNKQ